MKSYLSLIPLSAKVRRRQNRMTLICIVIAVFLVTTVFSMIDTFLKMEKLNLIKKHGYYHISLQDLSEETAKQIGSRSDVHTIAWYSEKNGDTLEDYSIGDRKAVLYGVDPAWIVDIRDCLQEGFCPQKESEVMLSPNIKDILEVEIGDPIVLHTPYGMVEYTISGFGEHDETFNKLYDTVSVYMNRTAFSKLCEQSNETASPIWYIRFYTDKGVDRRITKIKNEYGLWDKNIDENTALLGITGYSSNEYARNLYPVAVILFVLILAAGVFMIASSMNSNVAGRTQFFGIMRCIGMSRQQIIRFVRLEALNWCKIAIPIGILLGIAVTWGLCFWLRYGIGGEFSELPLFTLSAVGMIFGVVMGGLTVLIAASSPAKRAARVSPVAAVSGNVENAKQSNHTMRIGLVKIETALGIHHAISAKKNWILMTGSFAISIVSFFGFSAGLDFAKSLMPSLRSWQPDFGITSEDSSCSLEKGLVSELEQIPGVSRVYGIMAAFDVPVTTKETYPAEKAFDKVTLVSYEEYLFRCAKESRISGDLNKVSGDSNYLLTVYNTSSPLEAGDKIEIHGTELEIAGIVSEGVFEDDITLIATEETFERLMGKSGYMLLSIQFSGNVKEEEIRYLRSFMSDGYRLSDYRDDKKEMRAEFWAIRLIVYAFLAIIVLIAVLNIINSTSMSVSARMKQYGAMRAVGMDGRQLTKMIEAEVFTYAFSGCVIGCALGLPLNKMIFESFITVYFGEVWHVPVGILGIILFVMLAAAAAAVYIPAKRMRNMAVTETINEM